VWVSRCTRNTDEVMPSSCCARPTRPCTRPNRRAKTAYHVFDAEQDRSLRGQFESLERIREALVQKEFVLYYQPKVNMRTGR
jgi:hypothetical protein